MIVLCELQCKGFEHVEFNAAFLKALIDSRKYKKIIFFAEKQHISQIKEKDLNIEDFVEFRTIEIASRSWLNYRRFVPDLFLIKNIFNFCENNLIKNIIFTSVNSSILISTKILLNTKTFSLKIFGVIHGILESINKRPSLRPWEFPFWFKWALVYGNSAKLNYIVLGDCIKQEVLRKCSSMSSYIHSINHPYIFESERPKKIDENKIIFGSIGVGSMQKGTNLFFDMARKISAKNKPTQAEFVLAGHIVDERLIENQNEAVLMPLTKGALERSEFERLIYSLDYAVFFYPANVYSLTASGAFMDALAGGIPIIALKNPLFEYYFSVMGDIGYLCENFEEMEKVIEMLLDGEKNCYNYMMKRKCIIEKRQFFSTGAIGKSLEEIL